MRQKVNGYTIKWIICRFDCEHIYLSIVRAPLETSGRDRLLIVKLNKTYTGSPTERIYQRENMYEKTRKYWKLNPEKAQQADFVLAVFKKVVRAVYKPERWFPVQNEEMFSDACFKLELDYESFMLMFENRIQI